MITKCCNSTDAEINKTAINLNLTSKTELFYVLICLHAIIYNN